MAADTVGDLGEKRIVSMLRALIRSPDVGVGIGDDGAVVPVAPEQDVVLSTEQVPTDLLARRAGLMDWPTYGRYVAEVNLSDVAAMGATPKGLLLAIGVPNDFLMRDLQDFVVGFADRGESVGAPLIGGDTKFAAVASFVGFAMGTVPTGQALRRGAVAPGDRLFVSGPVGGPGAALSYFFRPPGTPRLPEEVEAGLLARLLKPNARLELGVTLRGSGRCTSCIDITDGLGQSLVELAGDSDCEFDVDESSLPLHPGVVEVASLLDADPFSIAFGIGLDLELLGTWRDGALPDSVIGIGRARRADGGGSRLCSTSGRRPLPGRGFEHFVADPATFLVR